MSTLELHEKLRAAKGVGLDPFLESVLEEALRAAGATQGSLMLLSAREGLLEVIRRQGPPHDPKKWHRRFKIGEGIAGKVVETGQPYVCPDVTQDPNFKGPHGDLNLLSLLAVPIAREGRVIGVISVDSPEPAKFSQQDADVLMGLSRGVAEAIDQLVVDTFIEHRRRLEQIESLREVGQEISRVAFESPDELSRLLAKIAQYAEQVLAVDLVTLYQYYEKQNQFETPPTLSGRFYHPEWMVGRVKKADVCYRVIEERKSLYTEDIRTNALWRAGEKVPEDERLPERPSFTDREAVESAAGILLKAGKEVVGVMFIASRTPRPFSDEDKRVIETFAAYAAVAIQGARRFVERVTEQRAALQQISRSVAHRLRNVLPVISDRLERTLAAGLVTGDGVECCRLALAEARRAQKIVSEFERFSREERFDRPDVFTASELVNKLAELVKRNLIQAGAQVEVAGGPDLPQAKVNFDHLSDDFLGFLRDSERHTPSGLRITLSAEVATEATVSSVELKSDKTYLKLIYTDNGLGVAEGLKERIFEPLYTTTSGSGLGLAIARYNAKVHGGTLVECGRPGSGVRFELYLPALEAVQTGEGT